MRDKVQGHANTEIGARRPRLAGGTAWEAHATAAGNYLINPTSR